jgi:hypothetical protein
MPEAVSANDARTRHIAVMGEPLGEQFHALWQEVAWLHIKWSEFVEIFGTSPERITLLNKAAPSFFRIVQDTYWQDILMHLTRLTDSSQSVGKDNLTIVNLPNLISDPGDRKSVEALVSTAREKTGFCRDWRNRHIAHRDLQLALRENAIPLEFASREHVADALTSISKVLNAVEAAYMGSSTYFQAGNTLGGALSLLHVLDNGVKAQEKRRERLSRGEWSEEDCLRPL